MQDEDKDDNTYGSDIEISISNPISKKKKKKATIDSNAPKFYKYALGKVVDGPIINPMEETSYFLKQLLSKGSSTAILNQTIIQYGTKFEECHNNVFYACCPNLLTKLYQGKYRELDFSTSTLQDDNQDSLSVGTFFPLTKPEHQTLLKKKQMRY